jgi:hypothetical protein
MIDMACNCVLTNEYSTTDGLRCLCGFLWLVSKARELQRSAAGVWRDEGKGHRALKYQVRSCIRVSSE